jgi:hypothetical protein
MFRRPVLASCLAYTSALRIVAVRVFELLVNFYQSIWRHVPKDSILPRMTKKDRFQSNFVLRY